MKFYVAAFAIFFAACGMAGELVIRPLNYKGNSAFQITNGYYSAMLVPDSGGRILELIDLQTKRNLVYDNEYGGLLDDHYSRFRQKYEIKWVRQDSRRIVAELTLNEAQFITKKITFYDDSPVIKAEYHLENHTQEAMRLLFRNVIRPGGTSFTGKEIDNLARQPGKPYRQFPGTAQLERMVEPWGMISDPESGVAVGLAFEGENLTHLYAWREGHLIAPTFEYVCDILPAGKSVDFTCYWFFAHNFETVDYACKDVVIELNGLYDGRHLTGQFKINPLWPDLGETIISVQFLDNQRRRLGESICLVINVDKMATAKLGVELSEHPYVIAEITISNSKFGTSYKWEKVFARDGNEKLIKNYQTDVKRIGKTTYSSLPQWLKEEKYQVKTTDADIKRGYQIYSETGRTSGIHGQAMDFSLGLNESESFALHFLSRAFDGNIQISALLPDDIKLEIFDTRIMPTSIWGRVHNGYKLIPANAFSIKPGQDRIIYFRLTPDLNKTRNIEIPITFAPEGAENTTIKINLKIFPVKIPGQPRYVFDVNNLVNMLCKDSKKNIWNESKANNYLADMMNHGVRGQTTIGPFSPVSYYDYDKVKIKGSSESLMTAIKNNPQRFQNRTDLPALDFSFWDFMTDKLLDNKQTFIRWPSGSCYTFFQLHNQLTKLIYGRIFEDGDIRQQIIHEWYIGEVIRYFKDRGIPRVMATIDDEINSERYTRWAICASRLRYLGANTGVTQNAMLLANSENINMLAPFMNYWILGTVNLKSIQLRRQQGVIKKTDYQTTYFATANHWRSYEALRLASGIEQAWFEVDGCWIQCYFRSNQLEAIIYPGESGPYDSAAWEGAKDGLDDANYYLTALNMIRALSGDKRLVFEKKLEQIVGYSSQAVIPFVEKVDATGMIDTTGSFRGKAFVKPGENEIRLMKDKLLELITELEAVVPKQQAAANFGELPLLRDGKCLLILPEKMTFEAQARQLIQNAAGGLSCAPVASGAITQDSKILFLGTFDEFKLLAPALACRPALADLSGNYLQPGTYVVRQIGGSWLIIVADKAAADKAVRQLSSVITYPRELYSHFLGNN